MSPPPQPALPPPPLAWWQRLAAAPFRVLIALYRYGISPVLHLLTGPGGGCRFHPTCSVYAAQAFRTFPVPRALWLTLRRLARCHPWSPGGEDPLPGLRAQGSPDPVSRPRGDTDQ